MPGAIRNGIAQTSTVELIQFEEDSLFELQDLLLSTVHIGRTADSREVFWDVFIDFCDWVLDELAISELIAFMNNFKGYEKFLYIFLQS